MQTPVPTNPCPASRAGVAARPTGDAAARAESPTPPAAPADAVSDPRLVALLPAQLLQPGETVILLIKPSPWYVLLEPLPVLTVLALATMLALTLARTGWVALTGADVLGVGVVLALVRLAWQFLEWLSRVYVLTDRRVIRVRGVLRVSVFECSLKRIQHTLTSFSIRERLFGLGTVSFATAGTAGVEASWRMVARPLEVHETVVATLHRYR